MDFLYTLASIRTPFLNTLFSLLTHFGDEIIVIGIIGLLFWCINKKAAYRLGFVFFASGLLCQGLKVGFRIERPWVIDPDFSAVESAVPRATGYSFPSGHTQAATALYGSLAFYAKKAWVKAVCVLAIVIVGFSRLYLGVHTALDVLTAAGVTGLMLVLLYFASAKLEKTTAHDIPVAAALAAVSALLIAFVYIMQANFAVADKDAADACKAAGAGIGFALGWFLERRYIRFDTKMPKLWMQAVKLVCGLALVFALKEIPKLIFPDTPLLGIIRYFIIVFFAITVYPWLVMKVTGKSRKQGQ